ncbi:MAG: hypothetical protein Q7S16_00890 [bacterium]|nr:hypothetical protein [bacterium]
MDKTILEQLKKKLQTDEQRLVTELATITGGVDTEEGDTGKLHFPQYGAKDDENAAEVATFSDSFSLKRKIEESLHDVRGALARIEKETYGICRYCAKPIDERRLIARPESGACVACKEELSSRS